MNYPKEKQIPVKLKPGDYIIPGVNNQLIKFSFNDDVDDKPGYIDISIYRKEDSDEEAEAKIFIGKSKLDNKFDLDGEYKKDNDENFGILIKSKNIRIVPEDKKNNLENIVLGNTLISVLKELIEVLKTHAHPMESPPIAFLSQFEKISNDLKNILGETIVG